MSDDYDEPQTVWERVKPRRRPPSFEGEDRRAPPPPSYIKDLLPYIIGAAGIYASFQVMEYKLDDLREDFNHFVRVTYEKDKDKQRERDTAQWERIGDNLSNP